MRDPTPATRSPGNSGVNIFLYRTEIVIVLSISCVILSVWIFNLKHANRALEQEIADLTKELNDAVSRLAELETQQKSKTFMKVVDLLAAAGVPGLVLLGAMAVSG